MDDFEHHEWGMGWGWLLGLVVLIFFVWLIIRLVNRGGRPTGSGEKTAMDILKERYARGEISKEEYKTRKKDLM